MAAITSLNSTPDLEQGTFGSTFDLQSAINNRRFLEEVDTTQIKPGTEASAAHVDALVNDAMAGEKQLYGMQFPKLWKIDMSLTILHDHMTGHGAGGLGIEQNVARVSLRGHLQGGRLLRCGDSHDEKMARIDVQFFMCLARAIFKFWTDLTGDLDFLWWILRVFWTLLAVRVIQ